MEPNQDSKSDINKDKLINPRQDEEAAADPGQPQQVFAPQTPQTTRPPEPSSSPPDSHITGPEPSSDYLNSVYGEAPPTPPVDTADTPRSESSELAGYTAAAAQNPPKKSKKKYALIGSIAAAVILLLGAGAVFGLYLPNKPENVWSTGLSRTGKTVDQLVVSGTEEKKIASIQNSEFSGTVEANYQGKNYKGTFNTKYDAKQSDSNATYKSDGEKDFNLKLLTDLADGEDYPSIYFQLSGLSALGVDQFYPGISDYEGKWIAVSSAYLKSALPIKKTDTPTDKKPFTQQDAAELARIVSAKTHEYVFTNDPAKAILIRKSFVGTEKLENNITANHYKVGINKGNTKLYCKALIESFMSADAYKRIPGVDTQSIDKDKAAASKSCEESIDKDIQDSEEFDVWIDKKNKLIHKIRFTNKDEAGTYVEVGQNYVSGDVIPLFIKAHSDKDKYDTSMTLEVDTKKSTTKGSLSFSYNEAEKSTFNASFEFKPVEGDVKVEKPADAIPIEKLLEMLEGGAGTGSPVNGRAADTERESDIRAIHAQLEAYYSDTGFYPALSELNDSAWLMANMRALDGEALRDPGGTQKTLTATGSTTQYSYAATGCNAAGKNCQAYTLSATRSDGSKITKTNLN